MGAPRKPLTIGRLRATTSWVWVYCEAIGCGHAAPMPLAPLIIRWGPDVSGAAIRRRLRCSVCGSLGVEIRLPSWHDISTGFQPFPPAHILAWHRSYWHLGAAP
jgi:hypothetical protein